MYDRTPEDEDMLVKLTVGALAGFGDAVANNKIPPEKAAHKAVVMAESAVHELHGEGNAAMLGKQHANVFEKPDR